MKYYNCLTCGKENKSGYSKKNKYCNNKCQNEYQYRQRVKKWLEEGVQWNDYGIPPWVKRYLAERDGYKCSECGIDEWNGKPIVLECDHIDGDHQNNHEDNLRLLCPNCHSQTDTYKARNTGKGRSHRRADKSLIPV